MQAKVIYVIGLSILMLFPYLFFQILFINIYPTITLSVAFQLLTLLPVIILSLEGWYWGALSGAVLSILVVFYNILTVNMGIETMALLPVSVVSTSISAMKLSNKIITPFLIILALLIQIGFRWLT